MNPFEFARMYLNPYKTIRDEIIPKLCPFCHGGAKHDKGTFALNTVKLTYNCKRGKCGSSGTFKQLCYKYGVDADMGNYEIFERQKTYKKPTVEVKQTTNQAQEYLLKRKISLETQKIFQVGCDAKGNIMFPYYLNDELIFVKYRPSKKVEKGERKAWREEGCKPILYNMDNCTESKSLIITEGEIDAMAVCEAGFTNVVSVPSGSEDFTWIDTCWNWLEKFEKIILFGDNDDPGREMVRKAILKLGEYRCSVVECTRKDANELLYYDGAGAVVNAIRNAKDIEIAGIIQLSQVKYIDIKNMPRMISNIPALDKDIGGFFYGDLSIWTGKRGEGKSTMLGQLMLEAVEQDIPVCVYSGELRADKFQYWIHLQAAGPKHISKFYDSVRGGDVHYVKNEVADRIKAWYNDKFFLYDSELATYQNEIAGIIKVFEYSAKRYNCKVFLVDNLMTARLDIKDDTSYWRAQSTFVGDLKSFARKFNVHVHLVAHPRKTKGDIENDDVSGTGDITNRADNVLCFKRVTDDPGMDAMVEILKNRGDGCINKKIGLKYCKNSRRLYLPTVTNERKYGWEKKEWTDETEQEENIPPWELE